MKLIDVISARHSHIGGRLEMVVRADLGGGVEDHPYSYQPGENVGLNAAVAAWLEGRPDFSIGEVIPLPAEPALTAAQKLERAGLTVAELKSLLGLA